MIVYVILSLIISLSSVFQVNLYIPFKNKAAAIFFGFYTAASIFIFIVLKDIGYGKLTYALSCLGLSVVSGASSLLLCQTAPMCGIYNVLIQICINLITLRIANAVYLLAPEPGFIASAICVFICAFLALAWCYVMYRMRQKVWVHMPMPDIYYRGSVCFVLVDLVILLGAEWADTLTGYILYFIAFFILIVVLNVLRTPQDIMEERGKTQMVLYWQEAIKEYIISVKKYESKLSTMYHDFKHLSASISELIERNELDKASAVAHDAEALFIKQGARQYSENVIINAVVEDYASRFAAKDIAFQASVKLPPRVFVSELELTVMLHNILSNAYEYCSRVEWKSKPLVVLKIAANRNYIFISCENPIVDPLKIKDGRILSTKAADNEKHGIGIESIKRTVKKNNGEMNISADNDLFVISLMILNRDPSETG